MGPIAARRPCWRWPSGTANPTPAGRWPSSVTLTAAHPPPHPSPRRGTPPITAGRVTARHVNHVTRPTFIFHESTSCCWVHVCVGKQPPLLPCLGPPCLGPTLHLPAPFVPTESYETFTLKNLHDGFQEVPETKLPQSAKKLLKENSYEDLCFHVGPQQFTT